MKSVGEEDVGARTAGAPGRPAFRPRHALLLVACTIVVALFPLAGCGDQTGAHETSRQVVVEERGSIEPGDAQDPDYGDKLYDAYSFEASKYDRVRVEVAAEGFTPLLLLVETSTGAQLWEWQEEYSDEDALLYTIAGPGTYEARVYAPEGETGSYLVSVILND